MVAAPSLAPDELARIQELFKDTHQPIGGQFHMIGLEEIKERLGARWPKKRDQIRETAFSVLRRHLGAADICLPYGEFGFVVLFAHSDERMAGAVCGMVKAEILKRFVGEAELSSLDIRTSVVSLADGGGRETSLADVVACLSDGHLGAEQPADNHSRKVSPAQPVTSWLSVDPTTLYEPVSDFDHELTIAAMTLADLESAAVTEAFGYPADLTMLRFEPVCHVNKRALSIFRCLPIRKGIGGRVLEGYGILPESTETAVVMLDRIVLAHVQRVLYKAASSRRFLPITLPVSFETLSTPASRQVYAKQLNRLEPDLRRLVMPVIHRLPTGIPESRLVEIVGTLKPFVRMIGARVSADRQTLARLRSCGVSNATLRLNPETHVRETAQGLIERGAELVSKIGLAPTLREVRTQEQARRAVKAGYHSISGPAVACRVVVPHNPLAWSVA